MIRELGKGHLSDRLNLERKDEIGVLAKTMDQFADDLKRYVVVGMQQIAQGNINIETPMMDERDEIGPAIKMMVVNIGNMVKEMNLLPNRPWKASWISAEMNRSLRELIRK